MTQINTKNLSKYIANRLTNLSEEDIKSLTLYHPRRLTYFEIEILKRSEELLIKKIEEES